MSRKTAEKWWRRWLAYSEVLANEQGTTCAEFWKRAQAFFAEHGITIEAVPTDNAKNYTVSRTIYENARRAGHTKREAMRVLKRQLSNVVYRHMLRDITNRTRHERDAA